MPVSFTCGGNSAAVLTNADVEESDCGGDKGPPEALLLAQWLQQSLNKGAT